MGSCAAVPEKVPEELFWKRLHARVCLMVEREEHVAVHLKKLRSGAEAEDASESEEVRHSRPQEQEVY